MKLFRWCCLFITFSALAFNSVPLQANDDWWFDIEVIAFKRNASLNSLEEQFSLANNLAAPRAEADIISDVIAPDISWLKQGLKTCSDSNHTWSENSLSSTFMAYEAVAEHTTLIANANSSKRYPDGEEQPLLGIDEKQASGESNSRYYQSIQTAVDNNTSVDLEMDNEVPDAQDIAEHWLSFFGVDDLGQISVPSFSYCETQSPYISMDWDNQGGNITTVWYVNTPNNKLPAPNNLPITVEGHDWPQATGAHLLTSEQQALTSISRQIRSNPSLERLFHVTWRQPVLFGKDKAFNVRLYGGANYASQFNLDGEQRYNREADATMVSSSEYIKADEDTRSAMSAANDFFVRLDSRLDSPDVVPFHALNTLNTPILADEDLSDMTDPSLRTPIWEVDGTIKVFLKYINRVPYLHIDGDMFYRQPVPLSYFSENELMDTTKRSHQKNSIANNEQPEKYKLVSVPLTEQRRVISKQLHYFDHPLFGFVVQIRRYNRPATESE